jgi:hypothetical protein
MPRKKKNLHAVALGRTGGRPEGPKLRCWCGGLFTSSQIRKHMPRCPNRPPQAAVGLLDRAEQELDRGE